MKALYFKSSAEFRRWLERHHATAAEQLVGFYKKDSGKGGLTYPEAVDELLCFGWIDGVKKRVDDERYTHRITPRRPGSIWSNVNVRHAQRLIAAGKMYPTGLAAFQARLQAKTGVYSFEQKARALPQKFPGALEKTFQANQPAWAFWQDQPPGYRRKIIHWVTSAKQPATRESRLQKLIAHSTAGRRMF